LSHLLLIERSGEAKSLLKPLSNLTAVRWVDRDSDIDDGLSSARVVVVTDPGILTTRSLSKLNQIEKVPIFAYNFCLKSMIPRSIYISDISQLFEVVKTKENKLNSLVVWNDVKLDLAFGHLSKADDQEFLTQKEAALMAVLMSNGSKTVDRLTVKNTVWCGIKVSDSSLESLISRLRRRIERFDLAIESVYGGGYRII
jgi:DNA-binding response OmpR family regulator